MPRDFTPKVLTANDLLTGSSVWQDADGRWTTDPRAALLIEDAATADLLLLDAEARAHEVVGAYLADAAGGSDGPLPTHFRERMRQSGPSPAARVPA